jgi:hypothetical protein
MGEKSYCYMILYLISLLQHYEKQIFLYLVLMFYLLTGSFHKIQIMTE